MADKETVIQWKVNLDGQDNLSKTFGSVQSAGEKLKSAFASIPNHISDVAKGFITANIAMFAGEKALELVKEAVIGSVEEFDKLQHSLFALKNSMSIFGIYTKDNFEALQDFADKITFVTGAMHNEALEIAARNAAYGESTKQIQTQLKAAAILVELSQHTLTLTDANNLLIQSYSGMTKGVARYAPEIKTLSQEHAKAGGATDILIEKYSNLTFTIGQTREAIARQRAVLIESTQEKLGALFAPSLESAQSTFAVLKVTLDLTVSLVGYIKQIFDYFLSIAELVSNLIIDLFKIVVNLGKLLYNTVVNFIDLLVTGIEAAGSKIGSVISKALGFNEVGKTLDQKAEAFGKKFEGIQTRIADDFTKPVDGVDAMVKDIKEGSKDILTKSQLMANSFIDVGKKILDAPESYKQAMKEIQSVIKAGDINSSKMGLKSLLTEEEIKSMREKFTDFNNLTETDGYVIFKNNLDKKLKDMADYYRQGAISAKEYALAQLNYQKILDNELNKIRDRYKDFNNSFQTDEYTLFKINLDKKFKDIADFYNNDLISANEFALAKSNYQKALDQKRIELNANQATQWVNAVSGGVSSIISTLGTMFDKIAPGVGTLIATVINFLNKTKDEMKLFINGLIDQILTLPENIADSIPTIIETVINRIPEIISRLIVSLQMMMPKLVLGTITAVIQGLANILPTLMNVQFWTGIARNLFTALMDAFKNFFQALFFGSSDTISEAVAGANKALFNNNADAGTNKFQLKDMATERTEATLNQGIDAVITKGQKGLFQMLYEGLTGIFSQIGSAITGIFNSLGSTFYNLGNQIWYGFISPIGNFFSDLGTQIANAFMSGVGSLGGSFGGGGGGGIIGSIGGAIGSIGGSFGWAEGGLVGGSAPYAGNATGNDIVPAMLSPGEFVVNRQQMANKDLSGVANAMGISSGGSISLTINIAAGANITENQLKQNFLPIIISEIKKASSNGTQIVSKRGVY